jgi:hypothetical protein
MTYVFFCYQLSALSHEPFYSSHLYPLTYELSAISYELLCTFYLLPLTFHLLSFAISYLLSLTQRLNDPMTL